MRTNACSVLASSFLALAATGCTLSSNSATATAVQANPAFSGKVFGGQQPVKHSTITVWQMGTSGYGSAATQLATTQSDDSGNFAFAANAYTCPVGDPQVYITAAGGDPGTGSVNNAIMLAAGLGACSAAQNTTVVLNEVTTAATAYALASFVSGDNIGSPASMASTVVRNANAATIPLLVNLGTGQANVSTATTLLETSKLYTIADILAACVNLSPSTACTTLFADTQTLENDALYNSADGPVITDTFQAAAQMAKLPYQNVAELYSLISSTAPFPALASLPNDFSLAVAFSSPNFNFGVTPGSVQTPGITSSIDITSDGRIVFPSDKTGATGIGVFDPSSLTFAGPYGTSAGLTQPGHVFLDLNGVAVVTDDQSNKVLGINLADGSTAFSNTIAGMSQIGPLAVQEGNILALAGTTPTGSSLAYISADRTTSGLAETLSAVPSALVTRSFGSDYVYAYTLGTNASGDCSVYRSFYEIGSGDVISGTTTDTSTTNCLSGGIIRDNGDYYRTFTLPVPGLICNDGLPAGGCQNPDGLLSGPSAIANDGDNHVWVANADDASLAEFQASYGGNTNYALVPVSPLRFAHGATQGNTMYLPFSMSIDNAGNVWVVDVTCIIGNCSTAPFALTEVIGVAAPTITPLSAQFNKLQGTRP